MFGGRRALGEPQCRDESPATTEPLRELVDEATIWLNGAHLAPASSLATQQPRTVRLSASQPRSLRPPEVLADRPPVEAQLQTYSDERLALGQQFLGSLAIMLRKAVVASAL